MTLRTPYYLIDERKLLKNLKKIAYVRNASGAKLVLALKCFSAWCVFGLMKKYMDGTTSSSLYETRLGREKFAKEVHAYSVAFSRHEIEKVCRYADKIIFNSISQLKMFSKYLNGKQAGLRVNPGISFSHFDLADPARRFSRLGVADKDSVLKAAPLVSGLMFHFNCENDDFKHFSYSLDAIGRRWKDVLRAVEWVSLGGGIYFTKDGYPLKEFCRRVKTFADTFKVQVYLEPGETAITQSAELVTKILDIVHNEIDIAVVDASTEAHMLDLLVYRTSAKIKASGQGRFTYMIAGRSCLAGDVFGTYRFRSRLNIGKTIRISDAAGYTMVKKNWFNGLNMPSIAVKRLDGSVKLIRRFKYRDYLNSLS
jgi:carboxynorspermidine decarboxylase